MKYLGFRNQFYTQQFDKGYRGTSPHEASFSYTEFLENYNDSSFTINIKPYHGFGIGWGTFQMSLKKLPRAVYFILTPLISVLDKLMLRNKNWKTISNKIWIMSGIKVQQK